MKNLKEMIKQSLMEQLNEGRLKESYEREAFDMEYSEDKENGENFMNYFEEGEVKREMRPYAELLELSLYEEVFLLLEKNINLKEDKIEKNKHIREFFNLVFNEVFFEKLIDDDKILSFSSAFVSNVRTKEFLADMRERLTSFIDVNMINRMFVDLLKNNQLEDAQYIIKFSDRDMAVFPNTITDLLKSKNNTALRFVCKNMTNIHMQNNMLLVKAFNNTELVDMLIGEFGFDINSQSEGKSLLLNMVDKKQVDAFEYVFNKYKDKINLNEDIHKNSFSVKLIDSIINSSKAEAFSKIILNDKTLRQEYVDKIFNLSFDKIKNLPKGEKGSMEIFEAIFKHPNFAHDKTNLGQKYLIYGLLAELVGLSEEHPTKANNVLDVLNVYLSTTKMEKVPSTPEFNVVGAAAYVAEDSGMVANKIMLDALGAILNRYPHYINEINPNGKHTILSVKKDSSVYQLLIENGSDVPKYKKKFLGMFGNDVELTPGIAKVKNSGKEERPKINGTAVEKAKNNIDYEYQNVIMPILQNDNFSVEVKIMCQDMFLNSKKLLQSIEENKVTNIANELHFLESNFSNYLKESLNKYINVCEATSNIQNEEKKEQRKEHANKELVVLIQMLGKQLSSISESVFKNIEESAIRELKVQKNFISNLTQGQGSNESNNEDLGFIAHNQVAANDKKIEEAVRSSNNEEDLEIEAEMEIGGENKPSIKRVRI